MGETFMNLMKRKKLVIIGSMLLLGIGTAGTLTLTQPQTVAAATSCQTQDTYPETNILYCGLSGGNNASQVISSFQSQYKNNNDGHGHTDIQTAYNDTGMSSAMVSAMNTSNTKLGTAYKDGTIVVNGHVVGTDSWIGARWTQGGNAYKHIEGDIYTRSASTYFLPNASQVPVIVHFDSTGKADFAAMEPCGNMITFTAVPPKQTPPPAKSISCSVLTPQSSNATETSIDYTFTAQATAKNVAITSYMFNFGDNTTQTINTGASSATTTPAHLYNFTNASQTDTITVVVNGGTTSGTCKTTIVLAPISQLLSCVSLTANPKGNNTYTFTAVAKLKNTTITSYMFNFGDSNATSDVINTSASTAVSNQYTYPSTPGTYTANVTITGPSGTTQVVPACEAPITVTSTATTPPATPPATPTALVNAGAGNVIGMFGLTTVAGALFYHFVLRRKFFLAQ